MKRGLAAIILVAFAMALLPSAIWAAEEESAPSVSYGSSVSISQPSNTPESGEGDSSPAEAEESLPLSPESSNSDASLPSAPLAAALEEPSNAVQLQVDPANPAASDSADRANDAVYASIGGALAHAQNGDTILIAAGQYEISTAINVNKAVTLRGSGTLETVFNSRVINGTTVTLSSGSVLDNISINIQYLPEELESWNFNNNGVQLKTGATLQNSSIKHARNAVYVNNGQNVTITGTLLQDNRTGINMAGDCSAAQIINNTITDNWTQGLVMYQTATATQYDNFVVRGNTFDNWYSEVAIKSGLKDNENPSTGVLDVTDNTFADARVSYSTSLSEVWDEPGFADLRPVSLGGSATKPLAEIPTLRIYNTPNTTLTYSNAKTLLLLPEQNIADAVSTAAPGDTIALTAGSYLLDKQVVIDKPLTLLGGEGVKVTPQIGSKQAFYIENMTGDILFDGINIEYAEETLKEETNKTGISVYGTVLEGSLTVKNAFIRGAYQGIAVQTVGQQPTSINKLAVDKVSFYNNLHKDIYVENALSISLTNSLFDSSAFSGGRVFPTRIACDINLKYYDNFDVLISGNTFRNITGIPGNYEGNEGYGAALALKARNDGQYAALPAKIVSANIVGNFFAENLCDLMLGEAASGGALPDPLRTQSIENLTIRDNRFTSKVQNNYSYDYNLSANYWGQAHPTLANSINGQYIATTYYSSELLGMLVPTTLTNNLPPEKVEAVLEASTAIAENAKELQAADDEAVSAVLELSAGQTAYISKEVADIQINQNNQVAVIVYEVAPFVRDTTNTSDDVKQDTLQSAVTFRLPIPDNFATPYAKVLHMHGNLSFTYELDILGIPGAQYIEVSTDKFSQFTVSSLAQKTPPTTPGAPNPAPSAAGPVLDATPNTGIGSFANFATALPHIVLFSGNKELFSW